MTSRKPPNRPPKETQFKKGQSGNPKGRPKKAAESNSAFKDVLDLLIPSGGSQADLAAEDALLAKTFQMAVEGHIPSQRIIMRKIEERDEARLGKLPMKSPVIVRLNKDGANLDEALWLLDIVGDHPWWPATDGRKAMILRKWAAEEALSLLNGIKTFSDNEMKFFHTWVEGFNKLPWPGYTPVDDEDEEHGEDGA
jgi:hypothetical protein